MPDERIRDMGYDAAIAFNAGGQHNAYLNDGRNAFDAYDIPFFNYIVDHPLVHHGNMTSSCQNYYVICVDGEHKDYIDRHYPEVKGAFFLPLAGSAPDDYTGQSCEEFLSRPYTLGFTGSFDDFRILDEEIDSYPVLLKELINTQIDILLTDRSLGLEKSLDMALDAMDLKDNPELDYEQCAVSTRIVNRWIKAYTREETIRYLLLSGEPVHIWGSGWDKMEDVPDGAMILHQPVSYEKLPEICKQTKICFNVMPWFKDGMHDRIPTAMLSGAAVLTDGSRYIDALPNGGSDMLCLYDAGNLNALPRYAEELVCDPVRTYETAERGRNYASKRFTWHVLAEQIISIIDKI